MKKLSFKRLLKKRNNGGFTLLEVIISCALLSILVLGVMGFVGPVMNMVRVNEKNARATMLAETINSYISGCLKNAKMVEVFTLTNMEEASATNSAVLKGKSDGLNKINTFLKSDPDIFNKYDVRCLGISWMNDTKSPGKRKLVLTNNRGEFTSLSGDNYSLALNASDAGVTKVFDDALYNGLYPVIEVSNFSATKDADGNYTGDNANGYKVESKIYSDQKCYNILPAERDKSHLAFVGTSFIECVNMVDSSGNKTPASNVIPMRTDLQAAIGARNASRAYTSGDQTFYYPNTYIFYIVPKG